MKKRICLLGLMLTFCLTLNFALAGQVTAEEKSNRSDPENTKKIDIAEKKADRQEIIAEKKAAIDEKKSESAEKKCEIAQNRIANKLGQLENNRQMYQNVYDNMSERILRLANRLEEAGLDTSNLKGDLDTLDSMINGLYSNYDSFIGEFHGTQTTICEKNREEFKNQFQEIRNRVSEIKTNREAIRNFFESVIKPELENLKAQLPQDENIETMKQTESPDNQDVNQTNSKPEAVNNVELTATPE